MRLVRRRFLSTAAVKTVKVMTVFRRKAMRLSELARDNEAQRTLVGIGTQIVHKLKNLQVITH